MIWKILPLKQPFNQESHRSSSFLPTLLCVNDDESTERKHLQIKALPWYQNTWLASNLKVAKVFSAYDVLQWLAMSSIDT